MIAHKYLLLQLFLLFTFTITFGQGKENKSYRLFNIKKVCQQINSYKNYKIVTIDDAEEFLGHNTDNGGSLKGYYKSDSLKKIVEWVGLSNKVIQNEYYFNNRELIFVYSTESRYKYSDSLQTLDYSKLELVFKGRYYFDSEKLFDTIINDKKHSLSKQKDATDFLTTTKKYIKLLKATRK